MVTKRDLIIVLATFCLTFALFTIVPAGSNYKTSGTGEYDPWVDLNGDGVVDSTDLGMLGAAFGTAGDPTKNVNVTNWPAESNVSVTNFPSEYNSTITNWPIEPSWKVINVVENLNVTWNNTLGPPYPQPPSDLINLGSVPTSGYSRMTLFMRVTNYTDLGGYLPYHSNQAYIRCGIYDQFDYGEMMRHNVTIGWDTGTTSQSLFIAYHLVTFGTSDQGYVAIISPFLRLEIEGTSSTSWTPYPSTISCLVSIGIYMRNE